MTRLLRVAAVVVLVGGSAAALSSCSDSSPVEVTSDVPVATSPSPEPSATVSPTPTVLPPLTDEEVLALIPADAQVESFPGAVNFARFFLGMYPALFAEDSDTRLFQQLFGDNCGFCSNAVANARETRSVGAYSVGGDIRFPNDASVGGLQDDGFWYVSDRFEVEPTVTYGPDGVQIDGAPAASGEVRFRLAFIDGAWQVDEVEFNFDS